jgi:Sulfotransferase family
MGIIQNDLWQHVRRLTFRIFRPEKFGHLQKKRAALVPHRCIFVHIPKCAGSAVCKSLFSELAIGHTDLHRYQIMFPPGEFRDFFKFTFVRNPYDRLVSAFFFLKQGGMNKNDKEWADENLADYSDFDTFVKKWVNRRNIWSHFHFIPQSYYICLEKNRPAMDFIGYFENLPGDFQFISRKLNMNAKLLEANRNTSRINDYREYYTDETRKIVAEVYADDLRTLGYSFDNSDLPSRLSWRGPDGRVSL